MIKCFLTILMLSATLNINAQPKGFTKLNDEAEFRADLKQATLNTNSVKSNFTQVKNLNLLDEKVTSSGLFLFKKERKVKMEYTNPFSYLLVIDGDKIKIKDRQKTNSFSSGSNKLFTSVNNIIVDCVTGNVLNNKDFKSTVFSGNKSFVIELVPVKKELKDFFEKINVYIDANDFSVDKIDMIEPTGDNTLITFTQKSINAKISDEEFIVK